jgi:hypothetical protein
MASRRNVSREMNKLDVSSPESQISQDRQVDPPPRRQAAQANDCIVFFAFHLRMRGIRIFFRNVSF